MYVVLKLRLMNNYNLFRTLFSSAVYIILCIQMHANKNISSYDVPSICNHGAGAATAAVAVN